MSLKAIPDEWLRANAGKLTQSQIAERWGCDERSVRRAIERMKVLDAKA